MKKVIYTLSAVLLAGAASAQVVSNAQIFVSEGAVVSFGQNVENRGELTNKGQVHFRNDLTNEGVLRSDGEVVFDGYGTQEIKGTDVVLKSATLENNVTLATTLKVEDRLNYNNGVITSSEAAPLVFGDKANHFGASDFSHSVGTVTKVNAENFEFPVGDGATYRGFQATGATRGALSAEYVAQNPQKFSKDLAAGVDYVNDAEYWVLKSENANEEADVRLLNTYENNVAYLKRDTWTIADNNKFTKGNGLVEGVKFTSGRGKFIKKDIGVWPNPTQGDFNLKLTGMNDRDDVIVDVTNQDGRVVMKMEGKVSDLRKVYSLPQGMITTELTVRVINGEDVMTEKLILNR